MCVGCRNCGSLLTSSFITPPILSIPSILSKCCSTPGSVPVDSTLCVLDTACKKKEKYIKLSVAFLPSLKGKTHISPLTVRHLAIGFDVDSVEIGIVVVSVSVSLSVVVLAVPGIVVDTVVFGVGFDVDI